ncbi:MAG TPA: dCTP deaminase [Candidatus Paceibacterota bacterium]|nr:dCTP deaminase [Candidatus Paceibacterota bacterium]
MILSDQDIQATIEEGRVRMDPYPDFEKQLGPCSLDLHLGNVMKVFKPSPYPYLDLKRKVDMESLMEEIVVGEGDPFILKPNDFALALTKEDFSLPADLMARLDGRSSLGRLGLVVHSTAARFDPGWSGKAVMELGNLGKMPVILYEGMRICALTFETLSSPAREAYGSSEKRKYTKQSETPSASRISQEF